MLELEPEHLDHLERGGTLVVPSPQRAAAVRLAYACTQLGAGRCVWSSPDVLPWTAWLTRGLDEARARGVPVPRRLSAAEEWWLWREAVRLASAEQPILSPDALIDHVRQAALLLEDYGVDLREAPTAETAVLLRARSHFKAQCSALGALWSRSWSACAAFLKPQTMTRLAGFTELGPARRAWLERHGVLIEPAPPEEPASDSAQRDLFAAPARPAPTASGYDSPELEAEAAAQWCSSLLEHDPRSRLLIVVLRPEQHHCWLRALSQRLDYRTVLDPAMPSASRFAIEGGQPLTEYALVATALQVLSLAAGEADFEALSAVLRSPFIEPQAREVRLRIDLWLRQNNVETAPGAALRTLIEPIRCSVGEQAAQAWRTLIEGLAPAAGTAARPAQATASAWARAFAELLARVGWPGPGLDSHEQQVRMRFDELLGEFASLTVMPHALSPRQAVQLLAQLASRIAFEPASDDVPVTVTSSLEDPVVRYDGIWVAGLSADAWPQAGRSDPLIPWQQQRRVAMPNSDPADALRRATQAMRQWRHATDRLCLSWARNDGESMRDPSPLLQDAIAGATPGQVCASSGSFRLESWIAATAPPLETWRDAPVPMQPPAAGLRGGTHLLELQASCPFRSFAELRLEADRLPEPQPGIDARLRGQILHAALEHFWRVMRDSRSLQALEPGRRRELVHDSVQQALREVQGRCAWLPEAGELQREAQRDARLLERLVDWELQRGPFEAVRLEWSESLPLAGTRLQLRLDRVDRLDDGALIVIDYKSGAAKSFDPLAERPRLPQLLAYALAAGSETAAVVALHLSKNGLDLRGVADTDARLRDLRAVRASAPSWQQLRGLWRQQIEQLLQEFLAGHAAVAPQPRACDHCHLQSLCRVRLEQVQS